MKFLKEFLFTISLTFISFGVVTLNSFCSSAPVLDTPSFNVIKGNDNQVTQYSLSPEMSVMMIDQTYTDFRDNLYESTGFWIEDIDNVAELNYQNLVTTPNYNNASWLADKLTNGAKTLAETIQENYKFFKQSTPQFGNGVYRYFIGTENNGTVSNVNNSVNYITQEGLGKYSDILTSYIDNGKINNLSDSNVFYGYSYSGFMRLNNSRVFEYQFELPFPFFVYVPSISNSYGYHNLHIVIPENTYNSYFVNWYCSCNGYVKRLDEDLSWDVNYMTKETSTTFIYNGVNYYDIVINLVQRDSNNINQHILDVGTMFNFSSLDLIKNNINNTPSLSMGYSYSLYDSNGNLQQIALLLKELVGKWVSSDDLGKVNTIIKEIPIVPIVPDGGTSPIPQAQPTTQNLDDLEDLITRIVEDSDKWAEVLPEPESSTEPEPSPEPIPNYQGIEIPPDLPDNILTPVTDSVSSVFDFISIFRPLFFVFSVSTGLLGLWMIIPIVIVFLIVFRVLK